MARNGLLRQANFGLPCLLDHSSLLVRTGLTDEDDLLTFSAICHGGSSPE
jgi:hypothetical protein